MFLVYSFFSQYVRVEDQIVKMSSSHTLSDQLEFCSMPPEELKQPKMSCRLCANLAAKEKLTVSMKSPVTVAAQVGNL